MPARSAAMPGATDGAALTTTAQLPAVDGGGGQVADDGSRSSSTALPSGKAEYVGSSDAGIGGVFVAAAG